MRRVIAMADAADVAALLDGLREMGRAMAADGDAVGAALVAFAVEQITVLRRALGAAAEAGDAEKVRALAEAALASPPRCGPWREG